MFYKLNKREQKRISEISQKEKDVFTQHLKDIKELIHEYHNYRAKYIYDYYLKIYMELKLESTELRFENFYDLAEMVYTRWKKNSLIVDVD